MISVSPDVYAAIIEHAVDGQPEEVCGILGGVHDAAESRATRAERARNAASTPEYTYAIAPEEQLELMERIEADGAEVAGFYHSHPAGPPTPSETDAERATWPGLSYVIVVLTAAYPFVGSWRWNADAEAFEQEVVRLHAPR